MRELLDWRRDARRHENIVGVTVARAYGWFNPRCSPGMSPLIAKMWENAMQPSAKELLSTYLGKRTGERVLSGFVKRGDGEKIHAVIWYCDLRDSTSLAESMPLESFLGTLNDFFDCVAGAVLDHGGEILRFIGDAALAIFPIGGTTKPLQEACTPTEGSCQRALTAARDARSRIEALNKQRRDRGELPLGFGLALHVGDVIYGNIGVPERLEFTVVGPAANEAARLEALCKELDRPILISWEFPRCFPDQMIPLGVHRLRGVSTPREIFALSDDEKPTSQNAPCEPN